MGRESIRIAQKCFFEFEGKKPKGELHILVHSPSIVKAKTVKFGGSYNIHAKGRNKLFLFKILKSNEEIQNCRQRKFSYLAFAWYVCGDNV